MTLDRPAESDSVGRFFRRLGGAAVLGGLVRFTAATSRIVYEPPDAEARIRALMPVIFTCWHGQGFLWFRVLNFEPARTHILMSRHADGEFVAGLARASGNRLIEGSGANYKEETGTGGVVGLRRMVRALKAGDNVGVTADIPPEPGRRASDGIALLSRLSGRPILPFHLSSSRRRVIESQWDRMQLNYPFSRIAAVLGEPIQVPREATNLSSYTSRLTDELNRTLARAFEIADGAEPRT